MSVTSTATTDSAIETALQGYATTYRNGSATQSYSWTDEWYAIDGETLVTANTIGLTNSQKLLKNGCGLTLQEYNDAKSKMLNSIKSNGGFWIGRYEVGDAIATASNITRTETMAERITNQAVIKANQIPYNYVTCSEAEELAEGFATGGKTSSLLFGIQWDLVCKFLEEKTDLEVADINSNSGSWGNYNDSLITLYRGKYNMNTSNWTDENCNKKVWKLFSTTTSNCVNYNEETKTSLTTKNTSYWQKLTSGASEDTNKMNIYDFAGNEFEWTLEYTSSTDKPGSLRGGFYNNHGNEAPASCRGRSISYFGLHDHFSFRPSLY